MMALSPAPRTAEPLPEAEDALSADAEIVRAAIAGDARAFEQIVRNHQGRVFHFLLQMTRQREDAEDLTQQTFIKAHRHLDRVDVGRPITNWLLTIARRTALNHFRSAKKWESLPPDFAATGPSPADRAEGRDHADQLWDRARRTLSQREFEALWLRFAEEKSVEETADIMGLTRIHVKVLVHRARQHLLKGETAS